MDVAIVILRKDEAVGGSVLLKQRWFFGNRPKGEQDGDEREIIDMLVERVFRACRMAEVGATHLPCLLSLHCWYENPIIVYQHQRAVLPHHDVVGLQVAVGKWLRHQPQCETAELVGKQVQLISVVNMLTDILVEVHAVHPFHQQDGKLVAIGIGGIDEQFVVQVLELGEETRRDIFQFLSYHPIVVRAVGLVLEKALHRIELAFLLVTHLEHHGEVTAGHHGIAVAIGHRPKIAQLLEVVLCILHRLYVF